ncbi:MULTISPECIES: Hint domain-containing protein [unclassified Mameliella]|uniref:Hint domain-containing protein n=1 Tax=unclassified Mameliella TaxID=2630630 RepID=UPI00273FA40F|nr:MULTISPECIES: Hint domain-containing protein [unclassified Mameliella]
MGWIAVADAGGRWLRPDWKDSAPERLLPRGTLMVETPVTRTPRPERILSLERESPWPGSLSLTALPGEGLALVVTQGAQLIQAVLPLDLDGREDSLRITYAWDSPARRGRFAAERTDGTVLALREVEAPPPMLAADAQGLNGGGLALCALSEAVEPLGPVPTLAATTRVETPQGARPVDALDRADTVLTRSGEALPVLARLERSVPSRGSFRPVRLRSPFFGLRADFVVAPGQSLVVSGTDVAYLFGCEAVLVPASALVNGRTAVFEDTGPVVTWHQLLLPGHEALLSEGAGIESLYVGRLRRRREVLRETLLAEVPPGMMPEHGGRALKVLAPYEAITLAEARAA